MKIRNPVSGSLLFLVWIMFQSPIFGQTLEDAHIWCNGYDPADPAQEPEQIGTIVARSFHHESQSPQGGELDSWYAHATLGEVELKYSEHGVVIGTTPVVRPAAYAEEVIVYTGAQPINGAGWVYCGADYRGTVVAASGAPEGVLIPVRVTAEGHASIYSSLPVGPDEKVAAYASVRAAFICSEDAKDETYTVAGHVGETNFSWKVIMYVAPGDPFYCTVEAKVNAGLFYTDGSHYETDGAEALVDPVVEIDPSFPYANYFSLAYSPNIMSAPSPVSLSLQGVTNGTVSLRLNCPTNNVCAIDAATDLASTNWVQIAEVTNYAATVSFTDHQAGGHAQRFYKARALRRAN